MRQTGKGVLNRDSSCVIQSEGTVGNGVQDFLSAVHLDLHSVNGR